MTYRFNGPMGREYMKKRREQKRLEAEERNARTLPENRRAFREGRSTRVQSLSEADQEALRNDTDAPEAKYIPSPDKTGRLT